MTTHPLIVPARPGEAPFLTLHLTVDELTNIYHRHLSRIAQSGSLLVEFRSTRHNSHRGLTTTIHAVEDNNDS